MLVCSAVQDVNSDNVGAFFSRDVLGAQTGDPLSLFTSLLLVPVEQVAAPVEFVVGVIKHLAANINEEIEHFQQISNTSAFHANCSLLFTASLRYLKIRSYPKQQHAYAFVVLRRQLQAIDDSTLQKEMGHYIQECCGDSTLLATLSQLAPRLSTQHAQEVLSLWGNQPTEVPLAVASTTSRNTTSMLRVLPSSLVQLDKALLEAETLPADVAWLHQSERGPRQVHFNRKTRIFFLAEALRLVSRHPTISDAAVYFVLRILQILTLQNGSRTSTERSIPVENHVAECMSQFFGSQFALKAFSEEFNVRPSARATKKHRGTVKSTDILKCNCRALSTFVSEYGFVWKPLAHAVKAHLLPSLLTHVSVASWRAIVAQWKWIPFMSLHQKLTIIQQTVAGARSGNTSIVSLALCQRVVESIDSRTMSLHITNPQTNGTTSSSGLRTATAVQAIYSDLTLLLNRIGCEESLDSASFANVCDIMATVLRPGAPGTGAVPRLNTQFAISSEFLSKVVESASKPSLKAHANSCRLLRLVASLPSGWKRIRNHILKVQQQPQHAAYNTVSEFLPKLELLDAMLSQFAGNVPSQFMSSIVVNHGADILRIASEPTSTDDAACVTIARRLCGTILEFALEFESWRCDSVNAQFLSELSTRCATNVEKTEHYFALLPTILPIVVQSSGDSICGLASILNIGSRDELARQCLVNLLSMFKTSPWKRFPIAAAVEAEHWELLHYILDVRLQDVDSVLSLSECIQPDLAKQFIARALRRRYTYCSKSGSCFSAVQKLCQIGVISLRDFNDVVVLIVSNPAFVTTLQQAGHDAAPIDIIHILEFLLPQCPRLLKQRSRLVYVLLAAYRASMSKRDRRLLSLIELFEAHHCSHNAATLGFRWGKATLAVDQESESATTQTNSDLGWAAQDSDWFFSAALEQKDLALEDDAVVSSDGGFSPNRLFWTTFNFPRDRVCPVQIRDTDDEDFNDTAKEQAVPQSQNQYDPRFMLRLLHHYCQCTTLPLRRFFRMGCFGLVLFAATSKVLATRKLAYEILALVSDQLAAAKFPEAMQLRHLVLGLLQRSIPEPYAELPGIICSFVTEASLVLLDPASHLYVEVNQFLLSRPHLDLQDVPMFYACFQAGSPDAREVCFSVPHVGQCVCVSVHLSRKVKLTCALCVCVFVVVAASVAT